MRGMQNKNTHRLQTREDNCQNKTALHKIQNITNASNHSLRQQNITNAHNRDSTSTTTNN